MKESDILKVVKENNIKNIKELFDLKFSSESTIRRRLKELEYAGFLKVLYGGKIVLQNNQEVSLSDDYKMNVNIAQKRKLGKQAGEVVQDGDVIFLDNGTTVRYILEFLKNKNVEIYTNGYNHIEVAQKYNLKIRIIPGEVLYKEASIVGEEAIDYLNQMNFDRVFIGVNGFSEAAGVTTPNQQEAIFKKVALRQGFNSYILADSYKYNLVSKYKICDFDDYPIITLPISVPK